MNKNILEVKNLCKYFYIKRKNNIFSREKIEILKAVNNLSLEVREGESLAIVGESGSGKSTLGKTLARVYKPTSGEIWFLGKEISSIKGKELKKNRREIQMLFQDPSASLNPRQKISDIISLPLRIYSGLSRRKIEEEVINLIKLVRLPEYSKENYPNSLSGGEKQRVGIARAISIEPKILLLDEPTSALDVSVQSKIIKLLENLQKEFQLTYLLITHDLSVVRNFSNRIIVMYLGEIIEKGKTMTIFQNPVHPYTKALLSAIPFVTEKERQLFPKEITLSGDIPSPINLPGGCNFYSRCQERKPHCKNSKPCLTKLEDEHFVRCFL